MTREIDTRMVIGLGFLLAVTLAMCAFPAHSQGVRRGTCKAIDGDTLTCLSRRQRIHVRLSAIDAPELPGHCRGGRNCAPGDPFAAKANLAAMVAGRIVTWTPLELDRYGRTVALPIAGGRNLACSQLRGGFAVYWARYDKAKRLARSCPWAVVRG
jgi:micrococcal nuclease